jgi:hypothetical protein
MIATLSTAVSNLPKPPGKYWIVSVFDGMWDLSGPCDTMNQHTQLG